MCLETMEDGTENWPNLPSVAVPQYNPYCNLLAKTLLTDEILACQLGKIRAVC